MKTADFNKQILLLEKKGVWLLDMRKLRVVFPDESDIRLRATVIRMMASGNLVPMAQGLWARPSPSPRPRDAVGTLINHLRPNDLTYLSLESRLSELGVISQVPSIGTFMTTGRKAILATGLGTIEFVSTKRSVQDIRQELEFDPERGYYIANPALAYKDLKSTRRNLNLVDIEELADVIEEEGNRINKFKGVSHAYQL